ncbi:MAG: radical SAM protein, partial [Akkermansia sp.]|nr:radical SAM protein [Akkermansia sp.]
MINITRLWCGAEKPADHIRYGLGHGSASPHSSTAACSPTSSRARKPIVVWNITRTCNLRCVHCYADSHAQKYPGELTLEQCHDVIDNLADYQVNALLLSGGEPLLHPHLPELLEHATERGLKVTISTNGTRITPEYAAMFKRLGVAYVGISLDGIGPVHDSFRGVEGAFDGAIRGFKRCEEVGQK